MQLPLQGMAPDHFSAEGTETIVPSDGNSSNELENNSQNMSVHSPPPTAARPPGGCDDSRHRFDRMHAAVAFPREDSAVPYHRFPCASWSGPTGRDCNAPNSKRTAPDEYLVALSTYLVTSDD